MAANKKTRLQVEAAQKIIYELMMKGYSNYKMVNYLIENNIYKTDGAARKAIEVFNKTLYKNSEKDLDKLKQKYIEQYEDLYLKCIESKDRKTAATILNYICKLQGLDINKIEAKIDTTFQIEF